MSFLETLKQEANMTTTLNGAATHRSTGDACLDFFAVAGGMRYRTRQDQIRLFERAYIETPELAMKLLFHIRDIRGGMGERQLFRTLLRHVAKVWPESAKKNVHLIAEFGRWDDLLCLMGTPAQKEVIEVIQKQLDKDLEACQRRENGDETAEVSLLAKWLPSCNTSSHYTRKQAARLIKALHMDARHYRKMLTLLRRHSCITERYLTRNETHKICYEAVPANAMLKYRKAFARKDTERFEVYIDEASKGNVKMHSDTLYPYQIVRTCMSHHFWSHSDSSILEDKLLDTLWKNFSTEIGSQNSISIIDVSGSMYGSRGPIKPIVMALSLGLYYAERCEGPFHNHFITFSEKPRLVEIHGESLEDKLWYIQYSDWGFCTNLSSVFDLILQSAIKSNATPEEMPSVLYVFSDMEFDVAFRDPNKTVYDNARILYERHGYQLPAVVFHNVNSWQMQTPVTAHTRGTALVSGASTASLKEKFDGNTTPMEHMLRVLNSNRYKEVHA